MDLGQRLCNYLAPLSAILDTTTTTTPASHQDYIARQQQHQATSRINAGARISALVVLPNDTQDARHVYLDSRGKDAQDIRYQIASQLGVPLASLNETKLSNGVVAFFVNWFRTMKQGRGRGGGGGTGLIPATIPPHNERASFLLNHVVYGTVYFLHCDARSNCGYNNVRPELLKTPDVTPLVASRRIQLDIPPTLKETLSLSVVANTPSQTIVLPKLQTPALGPAPVDTTHKTGTRADTCDTFDPTPNTARNTTTLDNTRTHGHPDDTQNNNNTSDPRTPTRLAHDAIEIKAEKTPRSPPRPERTTPKLSRKRQRGVTNVRRSRRLATKKTTRYTE